MNIKKLAWRNLWRRKRRTYITTFSIGFGVMLAVTFTGTGDYGYTNMINAGADMGLGHITVEPVNYNQTPALDKRLLQAKEIRQRIKLLSDVDDAMVRILGQAIFASARKSIGGAFLAIDPTQESASANLFIDRQSTRLNSSHGYISYAVFRFKKKTTTNHYTPELTQPT